MVTAPSPAVVTTPMLLWPALPAVEILVSDYLPVLLTEAIVVSPLVPVVRFDLPLLLSLPTCITAESPSLALAIF